MLPNFSPSDWIIVIITITAILYWYGTKTHNRFVDIRVPYIKPVPFAGSMGPVLLQTQAVTDYILESFNKFRGYKCFGMFNFAQPMFALRDPELIKSITLKDFEHFVDRLSFESEDIEPMFAKGIFNLKGQRWRDMRSTLTPAFTSSKMKTMFHLMDECGIQVTNFLKKSLKDSKLPTAGCKIEKEGDILSVEMKDLYTRYTNDVIATAAFGISVDSLQNPKNEFYEMGRRVTNFSGLRAVKFFLFLAFPKIMKMLGVRLFEKDATKFFRHLVLDTIEIREKEGIFRPDMIHLLMQAKNGTLEDESHTISTKKPKQNWDDDHLIAQAVSFFFAGFDTAAVLLCFASYLLAVHPDIQTKLQNEIDEEIEKHGKVTYEDLHAMKYLDMVVQETLRLYPPVTITDRRCTKAFTLPTEPPVQIKPGEGVWISAFAIQHDPEFFPEPEKFDPERFSDENKHNIKPFTFIPFGSGPRSCIGNRFALMETKLVLVHLLSHFNFKVISKTPIPIKISKKTVNLTVDEGFWLGMELRNQWLH